MGWLLADYGLAIGWPMAGYVLLTAHGLAIGWAMGWLWAILGWLWAGYHLAMAQNQNSHILLCTKVAHGRRQTLDCSVFT